jgi:formamidopyrimidine-DNA glycosylase
MPELPEVEIVRRELEPVLIGQRLAAVAQRRPDLRFPLPDDFANRIEGRVVEAVSRRAKYLLVDLSGGDVLVMHLGMTGRFSVCAHNAGTANHVLGDYVYDTGADPKHDHVVFETASGMSVTYNDPRRFGFMLLVPRRDLEAHPMFIALGVEPLGNALSADYVAARARGRKADLKAFLMDQRNVAGLGNIYVCEALFRAGLSPTRRASCLATLKGTPTEPTRRLVPAIRSVLEEAITAGGSTLRDYRHADGASGAFQEAHAVYDRKGATCVRSGCGGTVRRVVQSARSTFYCPKCQR